MEFKISSYTRRIRINGVQQLCGGHALSDFKNGLYDVNTRRFDEVVDDVIRKRVYN